MKVVHRVTVTADAAIQRQLHGLGIEVHQGLVTFEVDESNPCWRELEPMLSAWQAVDVVSTRFTESELRSATSLRMASTWQHGYPQPDDDFGYLSASYDLAEYCAECGIGKRQGAPLRIKGEPKWGTKQFLQLNWIFDEFFVLPDVWQSTFEPLGIGYTPVVDHHSDRELETVVQLDIAMTAPSTLQLDDRHPCGVCPRCGRKKYLPITKGAFPPLAVSPTEHIQKTQEYFGTGGTAWRAVIVSSDVFERITEQKLKGVEFIPCIQSR